MILVLVIGECVRCHFSEVCRDAANSQIHFAQMCIRDRDDIALKIDTALYTIEKANPALKGALPDNYYSCLLYTSRCV